MKPKTILYVEDEEHDAFFMQVAFQKARVANPLQVVVDGLQAVAYLQGTGPYANREQYPLPSLMLLDLNLPCLSGIEVLRWIRENPELHDLPVVIFSSSSNLLDIARTKEFGIHHYLVKPHNPHEIVRQLEELITDGLLLAL